MRARTLAIAMGAGIALLSATAVAGPSEGERSRARALAYQGQEAIEKRDYAVAAQRFEQADSIVHAPTLLLGLARAQVGLGKLVAAMKTYRRIVDDGVMARSPQPWFKALEDAKGELALLKSRVPTLVIQVTGGSGARVTVDGHLVDTGEPVLADPGRHSVRATADGFLPAEVVIDARESNATPVPLELRPVAAVEVAAPPPVASTSPRRVAGFISVGFGITGLAAGGVAGAVAVQKHQSLAKECPGGRCETAKAGADLTSYHNVGLLSTLGFIGGAALLGTGVVLVLTAPKPPPLTDAKLSFGLDGVTCSGRF